jgi:hypothetical protein
MSAVIVALFCLAFTARNLAMETRCGSEINDNHRLSPFRPRKQSRRLYLLRSGDDHFPRSAPTCRKHQVAGIESRIYFAQRSLPRECREE